MSTINGKAADRTVAIATKTLAGEPTGLTFGAAIAVLADAGAAGDGAEADTARAALADAAQKHLNPNVRVGATVGLGAIATDASRRVLRKLVAGDDGRAGGGSGPGAVAGRAPRADVTKMLSGVATSGWIPAHLAATTASAVLAHRIGVTDPKPVEPPPLGDGAGPAVLAQLEPRLQLARPIKGFDVTTIPVKDVVAKVELAARERVTLPADAAVVGAFTCGPRQHVVMAPTYDADTLAKEPTVAGALLGVNETTGSSFVRWLVLTTPNDDGKGDSLGVGHPARWHRWLRRDRASRRRGHRGDGRGGRRSRTVGRRGHGLARQRGTEVGGVADTMVTTPRRNPTPAPGSDRRPEVPRDLARTKALGSSTPPASTTTGRIACAP